MQIFWRHFKHILILSIDYLIFMAFLGLKLRIIRGLGLLAIFKETYEVFFWFQHLCQINQKTRVLFNFFYISFQQSDFGLGGMFYTEERSQVVSFLYPRQVDTVTFLTKEPKSKPILDLVLKPLDEQVWICFFGALMVCFVFDQLYKRLNKKGKNRKIFWTSMYPLFHQQIYSFNVFTLSQNVWIIFWSFGTLVLTAAYAGCLFSFAIKTSKNTIDSAEELIEAVASDKIQLFVPNDTFISYALMVKPKRNFHQKKMELIFFPQI